MLIRHIYWRHRFWLLVPLLTGTLTAPLAQPAKPEVVASIHLEQKHGNQVREVSQNTVFRNGDILRFRLTSGTAGFLYVVDKGTTGTMATLFPGSAEIVDNRIQPGK